MATVHAACAVQTPPVIRCNSSEKCSTTEQRNLAAPSVPNQSAQTDWHANTMRSSATS